MSLPGRASPLARLPWEAHKAHPLPKGLLHRPKVALHPDFHTLPAQKKPSFSPRPPRGPQGADRRAKSLFARLSFFLFCCCRPGFPCRLPPCHLMLLVSISSRSMAAKSSTFMAPRSPPARERTDTSPCLGLPVAHHEHIGNLWQAGPLGSSSPSFRCAGRFHTEARGCQALLKLRRIVVMPVWQWG